MPDSLLLNRICFSSLLKEAPVTDVGAMNCSMV